MLSYMSSAAERNLEPIAEQLKPFLVDGISVLEIASGSLYHAKRLSERFGNVTWQPSDKVLSQQKVFLSNLLPVIELDVNGDWPSERWDLIVCINMLHISPWHSTQSLFKNVASRLQLNGKLFLYGPFIEDDVTTAESNLTFDRWLKDRDPSYGLRHLNDLDRLGLQNGLTRIKRVAMPANNLSLVYERQGQ